jgi:DNA polymerase-3 subunit epsilon
VGIEFTAIDFETANGFRGSPCSVGLVKVRDGAVVEEASWLMRPPEGHDFFDRRNIRIHGIEADMVAGAPRFGDLFPEIGAFIGADLLVAHNAAFDMGVIRSALEVSGLPGPAYDYTCSVVHSRRTYSLLSHSLPFAAEAAGVPLQNHHDAVEDARACAGIMLDIVRRSGAADMAGFFALQGMVPSRLEAYIPGVDPLSKATRAALERGTGSEAKAAATGWTGWPIPAIHFSATPWCSAETSQCPGRTPRTLPLTSGPARPPTSPAPPPCLSWATASNPETCATAS